MHAVLEQLVLTVLLEVVRHQQRSTCERLEQPHVDVIAHASIENDARRRVRLGHVVEVALPDERVWEPFLDAFDKVRARSGEEVSDKTHVMLCGNVVLSVNVRITRER